MTKYDSLKAEANTLLTLCNVRDTLKDILVLKTELSKRELVRVDDFLNGSEDDCLDCRVCGGRECGDGVDALEREADGCCCDKTLSGEIGDGRIGKGKSTDVNEKQAASKHEKRDMKCDLCDIVLTGKESHIMHLRGKKHQRALYLSKLDQVHDPGNSRELEKMFDKEVIERREGEMFYCRACDCKATGIACMTMHVGGTRHRSSLKKVRGLSEEVAGDSNRSVGELRCEFCQCNVPDTFCMKQHLCGERHRKALAREKKQGGEDVSGNSIDASPDIGVRRKRARNPEDALKTVGKDGNEHEFYCSVCDCSMAGPIPYLAHVNGARHRKRAAKSSLRESVARKDGDDAGAPTRNDQEFRCGVCACIVQGEVPYREHLSGARHRKMLARQTKELSLKNIADPEVIANVVDDEISTYKCKVCDCKMEGLIPYLDHMKGSRHRKTLTRCEMKGSSVGSNSAEARRIKKQSFRCKLCDCEMEGEVTYKKHLSGARHRKALARDSAKDSNWANLASSSSTSSNHKQKKAHKSKREKEDFFCAICNCTMAGQIPYVAHKRGRRHRRTLVRHDEERTSTHNTTRIDRARKEQNKVYRCEICNCEMCGEVPYQKHLEGARHRKALKRHPEERTTVSVAQRYTSEPSIHSKLPLRNEGVVGTPNLKCSAESPHWNAFIRTIASQNQGVSYGEFIRKDNKLAQTSSAS